VAYQTVGYHIESEDKTLMKNSYYKRQQDICLRRFISSVTKRNMVVFWLDTVVKPGGVAYILEFII